MKIQFLTPLYLVLKCFLQLKVEALQKFPYQTNKYFGAFRESHELENTLAQNLQKFLFFIRLHKKD